MSTDHLHKVGVTESNGDVISNLPRPLLLNTTKSFDYVQNFYFQYDILELYVNLFKVIRKASSV